MSDEVIVEADLPEPLEKVWRALSEPDLIGAWLTPGAVEPGPAVNVEVLDAEPNQRIRYAWREDGAAPSEVEFTLTPTPDGGVRLRVVHTPTVICLAAARARRGASMGLHGGLKWAA